MAIQETVLDVDAVWDLSRQPEYDNKRLVLIDGELIVMSPVKQMHGLLAVRLSACLLLYADEHGLGEVTTEVGHYPPGDRRTLLAPDVAFTTQARINQTAQDEFVPLMPDLAVEIASPGDSLAQLRRKAAIYLDNGARLVWIVLPDQQGVDVCRSAVGARLDIEFVGSDGALSGEEVLPGFALELSELFPNPRSS
ncbi:MAG: Uma2 family endonuclease [Chloroflexi bacterium]|nr:Uma2 family endonuclease [Chloroflexota bacterium]MCY3581657.1 Uma2 family endonuclease [Chloroflexota bacterium]MCY3716935.1 Uma2 family endonuclease [Chloroflexota bacterium]MDE2650091.1 Uma2 family endonuclease [Chloroflexota bacterium]